MHFSQTRICSLKLLNLESTKFGGVCYTNDFHSPPKYPIFSHPGRKLPDFWFLRSPGCPDSVDVANDLQEVSQTQWSQGMTRISRFEAKEV